MTKIKNILICGLGGVGSVYASKICQHKQFDLKILVDNTRKENYSKTPTIINDVEYNFEYITPESESKFVDLIIITTKFTAIDEVIKNIKNFIGEKTIIMSLMNGISSEDIIQKAYPETEIVKSYLICNSIIRSGRKIFHDNVNKIVISKNKDIEEFFKDTNINYEISDDLQTAMWKKYMLNVTANQLSAVTKMTFGEMNSINNIDSILKHILDEVVAIAKLEGVNDPEQLAKQTINTFRNMAPYGKTSMLQDIENNRPSEIEALAGTIIKLGKKYNVKTPYNDLFYYLLG